MTDTELLRQFEALELPFTEFTHRTHLKVGYLYISQHGLDAALPVIRARIQAYAESHCKANVYSETTTRAFVQLIAAMRNQHGATATADEFCEAHPELMTSKVLRLFYSPARLADPRHKEEFLEPDLAPLPKVS